MARQTRLPKRLIFAFLLPTQDMPGLRSSRRDLSCHTVLPLYTQSAAWKVRSGFIGLPAAAEASWKPHPPGSEPPLRRSISREHRGGFEARHRSRALRSYVSRAFHQVLLCAHPSMSLHTSHRSPPSAQFTSRNEVPSASAPVRTLL